MPHVAKTHDQWLTLICGVCKRKEKDLRNITDLILTLIHVHHFVDYSFEWMPSKVCKSCLNILREIDEKKDQAKRKLPIVNYENMKKPTKKTRQSSQCQCSWCDIGRLKSAKNAAHNSNMRDGPGRPSSSSSKEADINGSMKICLKCKGEFAPGKSHICNKEHLQNNLLNLVRESSPGTREIVTSKLLDDICDDKDVKRSSGTIALKTRNNHKKIVNIGTQKPPR